ncbi:MAG TPA: biotin/lipoyl-binding protein, partial [Chthoniobacterales bacterium]|nr:biotin/lipoyl-binding protein [Chthoniobacterales bacterium]
MLSNESERATMEIETAKVRVKPTKTASAKRGGLRKVGLIVLTAFFSAGFAVLILSGILSRLSAEKKLEGTVKANAIPVVIVVHPKATSKPQEIELPGTTQAFTEAPIYARTSGYLKKWYLDIGAHAKQGQLLAEIETPELDQQLEQAQNDLKTAQANLQLADVTMNRWVYLLKSNVISKQETDQAVSDFNAKKSTAQSA